MRGAARTENGTSLLNKIHTMGVAALIMSASILLSRVMGLVRDKVISWQFGATGEADLYFAAFVVPDFINYLLAGGYVSITLMPLLAKRFAEDEADAWKLFSAVFWWALVCVCVLTGAAWLAAVPLARIVAPGFDEAQVLRLAYFLRIILPAQIFFLSGACFTALLYLRRQFYIPALTPLIYNGMIILCGMALPMRGMEGFCVGVTVGAALGAWLLPWWGCARGGGLRLGHVWRHPLLWRFLCIALPLMLGQSVVMLNEQFLRIFGSLLGDGAVSLLSYARRLSQVPVGVIGQAAAAASYPFLASLAAQGDLKTFADTLRRALTASLALALPLSAWMIACAQPTMGFIFEGGRFGAPQTLAATPLLQIMLLAVPLWVLQAVLGRGFYAHGDTLTPALVGTAVTVLSLPLFYACLPFGAVGVVWVSVLGVVLYVAAIGRIWVRRQGRAAFEGLAGLCGWGLAIACAAGLAAYAATHACTTAMPPSLWRDVAGMAAGGAVFGLVYVPLALWRAPELIAVIWKKRRRA